MRVTHFSYRLEIIVFLSGAIVMVLELAGSRLLAPFVGTSIYVWTSLISVVLGSLSLGYHLGGKLADKNPSYKMLSLILLAAAESILLILLLKNPLFAFLSDTISDIKNQAIFATIILFSLPSVLFGMISPYAVRLRLDSLKHSASTVGNLYAISTLGSIVGTIIAGFFLIAYFSVTEILLLLAITALLTAILAHVGSNSGIKIVTFVVIALGLYWSQQTTQMLQANGIFEKETPYQSTKVYIDIDPDTQRPVKVLKIGDLWHSAQFLDSDEPTFSYLLHFRLADHFQPNAKHTLMIGGGAFTYPSYYLANHPKNTMDVVEIDPFLKSIAKRHFGLLENPRMTIHTTDGRIYVNRSKKTYDVIFLDAFGKYDIPFHMATREFAEKLSDRLTPDGVVVANIISALDGEKAGVLKAQYQTFRSVFPHVLVIPTYPGSMGEKQNVILIALKSPQNPDLASNDAEMQHYLNNKVNYEAYAKGVATMTDDFAPLELYAL